MNNCENVSYKDASFHCRCPICGDSKKSIKKKRFHLKFIDENNTKAHCFNCDWSGNFESLYAYINGITLSEAYKRINQIKYNDIKESLFKKYKNKKENKKNNNCLNNFNIILKDCVSEKSKTNGIITRKYKEALKKFRHDRKIPDKIELFISFRGKYKGRIIIPIIQNGNIVYFQARSLHKNAKMKYINPPSEKNVIPNIDKFDKNKYIVVTEGLIDSFMVDNGTCCLGKCINDNFILSCLNKTEKGVIIALDNDKSGKDSTLKIIADSLYKDRLLYFIMPAEYSNITDLNELIIKNSDIEDVYSFIVKNSYNFFEYIVLNGLKEINIR